MGEGGERGEPELVDALQQHGFFLASHHVLVLRRQITHAGPESAVD